ncbi:hypothetical protein [Collimonas humicola]|uniref:hypothetical protein n=1 Tax=Collimonas humicola TaxID=2825886 RepID=UPI001B8BC2C3|nr:hypothetical protein [Collimonas humicola]
MSRQSMQGKLRGKREVADVPEQRKKDKSLDSLINVRKQRIDRFERERNEAREAWRQLRVLLRAVKQRWRAALQEAMDYWRDARAGFLRMAITSGQFRKAKAVYERMQKQAAQLHLESREAVGPCKEARNEFFEARRRVMDANRQYEKICILRNEMKPAEGES